MATVLLQHDGDVAWLKMNRPEALNAFGHDMADEMLARISELSASNARAAILIGEGRAFSTGIDLKSLGSRALNIDWFDKWHRVIDSLEQLEMPLIVAARGYCLGGGLMLMLAADYRIAGDDLVAGLSAVKHGIIPGSAAYRLSEAIGSLNARRLCLFADYVDAEEALRLSLIDKIVPAKKLAESAAEVARRVSGYSATAVKETKKLLTRARYLEPREFQREYLNAQQRCLDSGGIRPWTKEFNASDATASKGKSREE